MMVKGNKGNDLKVNKGGNFKKFGEKGKRDCIE